MNIVALLFVNLLVGTTSPITTCGQEKNLLQAYQDSLSAVEDKLNALYKAYDQKQTILRQVAHLLKIEDLARIEEGSRFLLDNFGDNGLALRKILDNTQNMIGELAVLRAKVDGAQERLTNLEQGKSRSKELEASLVKQILRDQRILDSTRTAFLIGVQRAINEIKERAEEDLRELERQRGRLERYRAELKQKIEMETVFVELFQSFISHSPQTPPDLLQLYVRLLEAQERDPSHSYDSLLASAWRSADRFLNGVLYSRLRNAIVFVPPGQCSLTSGKPFRTPGFMVSSLPLSQIDVAVFEIASGNRSKSFAQELKSAGDRPAEEVSDQTRRALVARYNGRPLSDEEREYIEASGFESVSEKSRYGLVTSLYGVNPNPRHLYICWDQDPRDPFVQASMRASVNSFKKQREGIMHDAWRTGQVWNPRRLLVDINPMAMGYLFRFTPEWSFSSISLAGAGLARASVLVGLRYAITGTEVSGERYGFIGVQVSYLRAIDGVRKVSGKSNRGPGLDFDTDITKVELEGVDISLLLTLGRSLYVGAGTGRLTDNIEAKLTSGTSPPIYFSDRRKTSYYIFPLGVLARIGTNFAINIGGVVLYKGMFTRLSFSAGLGFNVNVPMVRFGS